LPPPLGANKGAIVSLFAISPVMSPAGTGTGAAKTLKAMERERMAMRVLLNILKIV